MRTTPSIAAINVGQLDQRITIKQRAAGLNSLGEPSGAWQDVATVWARVKFIRGREQHLADQDRSITDVEFVIRWRSDVNKSCKITYAGGDYEIVGDPVDIDAQKVFLEIACISGLRDSL